MIQISPEPVHLVFSCDTYHLMSDRVAYFRSLASSLRPGGRVAILDWHPLADSLQAYSITELKKQRFDVKWRMLGICS